MNFDQTHYIIDLNYFTHYTANLTQDLRETDCCNNLKQSLPR